MEKICECGCGQPTTESKKRGVFNRFVYGHHCGYAGRHNINYRGLDKYSFKHGMTGSPEHRSWNAMNTRCSNPRTKDWKDYGGKGIKVCDRWRRDNPNGFENFLTDVGKRPLETTLGRFGDEGNYEPGNVKWMTRAEQEIERKKRPKLPTGPAPALSFF